MAEEIPVSDARPDSGELDVSGKRRTGVVVQTINMETQDYNNFIPELGEPHPNDDELYFFSAKLKPRADGKYAILTNKYSWIKSGAIDSELRNQVRDFPLETHSEYLLRWDHYLLSEDAEATAPSWWAEAKSIDEIKDESDFSDFKLSKTLSATLNVIDSRLKPRNTYKKPAKSVKETVWFSDELLAQGASLAVGHLGIPLNRFGLGEDGRISDWFVTSGPIQRDGGYWKVTRLYEFSEDINKLASGSTSLGWDSDIYDAG